MSRLFYLLLFFSLAACEILEEDISHRTVRIVAPADRVVVTPGAVDFGWLALDDATGYELTLVSPSFERAERIALDTLIWADTLARRFACRVTLTEGEYEWSVAAFNSGYTTRAEVRTLRVIEPDPEHEEPEEPVLESETSEAPELTTPVP